METLVLLAVLGSALLHATWNALIKSSADRLVSMSLHDAVMWSIGALLAIFGAPVPKPEAIPYIIVSAGVLVFYRIFLLKAYRHGDFSRSYPIARGSAPLLVGIAGIVIGDDVLTPLGYASTLLISLGIVSLILSRKHAEARRLDRGLFYALATGCIIATYSVIDSRGVRIAETSIGFFAYLVLLSSSWLPVYTALTRRREFGTAIRTHGQRALVSGSCSVAAYLCVLWAYSQASAVQVVALRETSVIFGAIIGAYVLREGLGPRRIASAAAVATGVILLQLYG